MPLETATYLSDLNVANPAHTDGLQQADSHMRLLKSTIKATFPNFTAAVLASTQAQIDAAVAAVVTRPNATVGPGFIMDFAGTVVPTGWLECNGASVLRASYPDLFTAISTTWGAVDGTHFTLPPDRYRRGRTAAGAVVGTLQADQNKTHTHTGSGTTAGIDRPIDHLHAFSGTTGTDSPDHTHAYSGPTGTWVNGGGSTGPYAVMVNAASQQTGGASARHTHAFSGTSAAADRSLDHLHPYSFTTSGGSADGAEARPLTAVYLTCIKT